MLSFTGSLKIYVAVEPCDMRKGFEGLAGLVTTALHQDLKSGALFVFGNRRRTRLKILYFDGTGIWLMTKRLEEHNVLMATGRGKSHPAAAGSLRDADRWSGFARRENAAVV